MQCCVPNCASNELKPNKSDNSGLTFHELPEDFQTTSQLLQGLRLEGWKPHTKSYVCSLHLSNEDFVQTEMRALKTDVDDVPVTFEMNNEGSTESITRGNLCRMCLCSDRKVYNIQENELAQQYEFLTASKNCLGDSLSQYICWECKARLASFARLRSVALRSLELLQEFYEDINNGEKTRDCKLNIDRNANNSTPTLIQSNIELAYYSPNSELLVVFDVKPKNTVSSDLENRNDDDKSTKVPKVLSKGRKSTTLKSENDNSDSNDDIYLDNRTKVLNKVRRNTQSKNENDNSGLNCVNNDLENLKKVSKALSKGRKSTKVINENNSNSNYFEDIQDEAASKKSDELTYNSELEDMIYDSDSSKSENEDINRKLDSHLAKINSMYTDAKLGHIKRGIDIDCTRIKKDQNTLNDIISKNYKELDKTFSIKHLSKEEQLREIVQRKESDNYKNAGFKCDVCYRGFVHEKAFELHQMKHTDAHGPAKCALCSVHFKTSALMRRHIKDCHQNRYSCNACEYVTGTLHNAKLHVKFHKGTTYKCSQCDKTFLKKSSLLSHVRIHHPSGFVCRLCGFSFLNERGLHLHTVRTHKLEKQVPEDGPRCVECDIQFSTDAALTTHYQESNKHKDMFADNETRKRPSRGTKRLFTKRLPTKPLSTKPRRKRTKGPVNCELCDTQLSSFMKYRWHFKKYHPDKVRTLFSGKFMCEMCGLVCMSLALLEAHKDTHSDIRNYSCEECGKQFKTKQTLYCHKEKHLAKKFTCDICSKTFTYYSNMQRHKIIHENRKFDCNICGKSFNHPQNRQNHIIYVHLKKPLPVRRNRK